jgi:hypothetical protein
MKVRKVKLFITMLMAILFAIVGIIVGYQLRGNSRPTSCAELGATYLEIGKEELGITDFGSDEWIRLIDDETKFTNDCYKSMNK